MPNKIFDKSFSRVRTVYGSDEVLFAQMGDRIEVQLRDEFRHADITDTSTPDGGDTTHTLDDGSKISVSPTGAVTQVDAPAPPVPVPVPMPVIPVPPPHASQPPAAIDSTVSPSTSGTLATDATPATSDYDTGYQLGLSGQTLADDAPDEAKRGYADALSAQNAPATDPSAPGDYAAGVDLAKTGAALPVNASADTTAGYNDAVAGRA